MIRSEPSEPSQSVSGNALTAGPEVHLPHLAIQLRWQARVNVTMWLGVFIIQWPRASLVRAMALDSVSSTKD